MNPKKDLVDDYYTNISSKNKEEVNTSVEKKPKIKQKIVLKKKIEKKEILDDKQIEKEENTETKQAKSKDIIQNIGVVKNDGPSYSRQKFKPLDRKIKTSNKSVNILNKDSRKPKSSNTFNKKTNISDKNTDNTTNKKPNFNKKFVITKKQEPNTSTSSKNFKNKNSQINKDTNTERSKKPKFGALGERRTRGKYRFEKENEELTFVRSNKMSKNKKKEKKVEDIKQNLIDHKGETITISSILTVKELSEKIGIALPSLIAEFMKNGMMVNINSKIDFDTASIIVDTFEIKLKKDDSLGANVEDVLSGNLELLLAENDDSKLNPRPPVVSIMGHVDHGKTSLLDYIRKSNHVTGEAGGITQSIGAYQVSLNEEDHGRKGAITFLDTPGHEAFTVMRSRGAKATDIAVLVVASDEGVKPQTIESINHAKEANIPIIVAINKMDKPGANPDHVKGQLSEHGLTPEDWGGNTPVVPVSAISGFGVNDLLEMILLVAEMKELKANKDRPAIATVIESHLDLKLGPVATILINTGTINSGNDIVCQESFGKVKILKNFKGEGIKSAIPGDPVLVVGLNKVVKGGDILQAVNSPNIAKEKASKFKELLLSKKGSNVSNMDLLMSRIKEGSLKQLKIILKSDTNGSLEAIKSALNKLSTKNTTVSIIHSGVGSITEGDVLMGQGSNAILVGFNVGILSTAKTILDGSGVEYIGSKVIYHITEKIEKIISGMFDPKEIEVIIGNAKVGGIFYTSKDFIVLGLILKEFLEEDTKNKIENNALLRVIRKGKLIGKGKVESLKSGTLEVKELEGPTECGIKFVGNIKVEMGDELEIYIIKKELEN